MKITLSLKPVNRGAFNCMPAREVELEPKEVLCNDVTFPWESYAHKIKLFVVGNEFGPLGAAWANCESEAFDELADADLLRGLAPSDDDISEANEEGNDPEEWSRHGNHGEPFDMTHAWIQEVSLDGPRDWAVIAKFAEARGAGEETLDF